jgi:hypothetical protein
MAGDARDAESPEISRSIIGSREAFWEAMWKKTSSLFAVPAIGKSIYMPRLLSSLSEASDERNDAHRVCFLRDHHSPVPRQVPLVDLVDARLPNGRSCSLGEKASATSARTITKERRRRSVQEDFWGEPPRIPAFAAPIQISAEAAPNLAGASAS